MRKGAARLLEHWRVFESRDPEATRAFMRTKEFELDLAPREAGAFDFAANAFYLPNSHIRYVRYGAAVLVRVPAARTLDDYFIHLPVRGNSEVVNHAGSAVCAPGQAVVSSPTGHVTRSESGSERITVSLKKSAMMGQLTALLGDTPVRPLEFSRSVDLAGAEGQRFSRHVGLAIADLDAAGAEPPSLVMLSMYEQLIFTGLLLGQPSNYTAALHRLVNLISPGDVKRAVDFIEAHLHLPVTLADIALASGVPGRTLLEHFKDHRGVSPMRYVRDARFARVREALLRAEPEQNVTQIAMTWGFYHLGRFAAEYCGRFGETPSQTYRRGSRARR